MREIDEVKEWVCLVVLRCHGRFSFAWSVKISLTHCHRKPWLLLTFDLLSHELTLMVGRELEGGRGLSFHQGRGTRLPPNTTRHESSDARDIARLTFLLVKLVTSM